jgi:hypothetical protein
MMHTRLAYDKEPEVIDEYIAPIPRGEMPGLNDHKAYGPQRVHLLARRKIGNGGGATRASTNADSYAMLANCLWWWSVTGYFPGVPGYSNRAPVDINDNIPVSLYVNLGNKTDLSTANLNSLFEAELYGYRNGGDDQDSDNSLIPGQSLNPTGSSGLLGGTTVLKPTGLAPGRAIKKGTKLRILGVGDSITVGFPNDGDGNGYKFQLKNDLSG